MIYTIKTQMSKFIEVEADTEEDAVGKVLEMDLTKYIKTTPVKSTGLELITSDTVTVPESEINEDETF